MYVCICICVVAVHVYMSACMLLHIWITVCIQIFAGLLRNFANQRAFAKMKT